MQILQRTECKSKPNQQLATSPCELGTSMHAESGTSSRAEQGTSTHAEPGTSARAEQETSACAKPLHIHSCNRPTAIFRACCEHSSTPGLLRLFRPVTGLLMSAPTPLATLLARGRPLRTAHTSAWLDSQSCRRQCSPQLTAPEPLCPPSVQMLE